MSHGESPSNPKASRSKRGPDLELIAGIHSLMVLRGWNARELAKRAGIAPSTLSAIFNGQSDPGTTQTLAPLARALGVTRSQLLREGEEVVARDRARRAEQERQLLRDRLVFDQDLELAVSVLQAAPEDQLAALISRLGPPVSSLLGSSEQGAAR